MPLEPTNIQTLGSAIFARLDAQDALREAAFKGLTAEMHEVNINLARLEERFDAYKTSVESRFGKIESDSARSASARQEAGKERANWIRTLLTLIGGAGIIKAIDGFARWARGD